MTDDDEWVARLLGSAPTPTMPDDVADRLERTLREHLDADRSSTAPVVGPVPHEVTGEHGSDERVGGDEPDARPLVPPAAVPPPAGDAGSAVAPLRAGAQAEDGDGAAGDREPTADGEAGSGLSATRSGRTFGSSSRRDPEDEDEGEGERRRRLLLRWGPVAAGVLVLGGAGLTAANLVAGEDTRTATDTAQEAAAAGAAEEVAPRALVATGTEYDTADQELFAQQVRDLVAVAASGESEASALSAPAEEDAEVAGDAEVADDAAGGAGEAASAVPEAAAEAPPADPASARAAVEGDPLTDQTAFAECVDAVTEGSTEAPAAVDLAVVDGVESTVVVVPAPTGDDLFVYVVGPGCSTADGRFDFYTVTP